MRRAGSFDPHLPGAVAFLGAEQLVAVVELQDGLGDPHVDRSSGGRDPEADLLPADAHHPDGAGSAGDPGAVGAVLGGPAGSLAGGRGRGDVWDLFGVGVLAADLGDADVTSFAGLGEGVVAAVEVLALL